MTNSSTVCRLAVVTDAVAENLALVSPEDAPRFSVKITHSVIVPVYNSAATLQRLYDRLVAVMEDLDAAFEIIFIDDCSTDESWLLLSRIAQIDGRVVALQLASNAGQGHATLIGLQQASGETLDHAR